MDAGEKKIHKKIVFGGVIILIAMAAWILMFM
jgi:hypothetical protein